MAKASQKKKPAEPSSEAPKSKGPPKFTTGTWIGLATMIPSAVLSWNLFQSWNTVRTRVNKRDAELAAIMARNTTLAPIYDILQNRKFLVCNKTPLSVRIPWVAAAFNDGKQVRVFDSSRCRDWKEITVNSGENKVLNLSSSQEGCNWNGSVMYYVMRLIRQQETEERIVERPYDYADLFRGYDRDCLNVE